MRRNTVKTFRASKYLVALLVAGLIQNNFVVAEVHADTTITAPGSNAVVTSTSSTSTTQAPSTNSPTNAPLAGGSGVTLANDNSLIVQYRNVPSVSTQSTMATSLAVQSSQSINISSTTGTFNAQILDFASAQKMATAQATLSANSNVVSVTPNLVVTPQVAPNDPFYGSQWAPAAMNLPAAWDTTTGSSSTIVAVLDTGVLLTHPDLVGNLWTNPADGSHGYNYVDGNTDPTDVTTIGGAPIGSAGHGTHVAGIIGASGNNGIGVAGVNWNTSIMALRVCGPRYGNTTAGCYLDWVLQALQFAYDHGARVINESFGGPGAFATAERDMITAIAGPGVGLQKGALVVAAAGNSGMDTTNSPFYPASYNLSNLVSVGALGQNGAIASFSNYGWNSVDVLAPGENIYSTMVNGTFSNSGDYGYLSGTSMAAPEVSGLAALIFTAHPTWTPAQVKRDIIATSTWNAALAPYAFSGGVVNAQAALAGTGLTDTMRLHISGTGGGSLSVNGNASCSSDCNIQIVPQSTLNITNIPNTNSSVTWGGSCIGTPAANSCSYVASAVRPFAAITFNAIGGSGIAQTSLNTTPDTLATPIGDQSPVGMNFVGTVLNPSATERVKFSFYLPLPKGSLCSYNSSNTGGVTVEHFDSGTNSWIEEAKFTAPALGDFTPGSGGLVHWPQIDNCFNFGYESAISDDGNTLLIPLNPDLENGGTPTEFSRCGVMVYKRISATAWNTGSLIVPADYNYCTSTFVSGGFSSRWFNIYRGALSGNGNAAVMVGSLSQQIVTMNLAGSQPVMSAPFVLPNSCRTADLGSWNGKIVTMSGDGSLILLAVNNCTDNASAILLANNGTNLSLVKSFNEIPFIGGTNQMSAIALSGDSQTVALSFYPWPAKVAVFENKSGVWNLSRTLTPADGLTNSLICSGLSTSGDRLLCSDSYSNIGNTSNMGFTETIDRISSSWSLGQPIPTIAWSDIGSSGDFSQLTGVNGLGTILDQTVGVTRLGDGTYSDHYLGQTFTIPTQPFNNISLPSIVGAPAVGIQLTAAVGVWSGFASATTAEQWYKCPNSFNSSITNCTAIASATSATYTPTSSDLNSYLRVRVTKTQGAITRQVFSTPSTLVLSAPPPAPTITSVSPTSGSTAGGTSITITGTGFLPGATVMIGGVSATVGTITSTSIAVTTPVGTAGAKDIVVTNSDAQSATGTGLFTYIAPNPAPSITSINPTSGPTSGGTPVTITGTGFLAGATVTIGGVSATVGTITSTSIAVTTPAGSAGAKNIVVTNTDSQSATGSGLFTYIAPNPAPSITSINPTSGPTAGGTSITITGTGFLPGATVSIGGVSATVGTITSTSIAVTTPAGSAGAKNIVVTNTDSQTATGVGLFTYIAPNPAPTITSVSPTSGATAGGTSITITGTGFLAGATVTIGGISATVDVITATSITATTPAGSAGAKNIVVTNTDSQSATGTGLYAYVAPIPAPTVTSVSPTSGPTAGGTSIVILGTGFQSGATVKIGGVSATVGPISATSISATTPAGSPGAKDIVVTNPDAQSGTGTGLFTYVAPVAPTPPPAPTISSVNPSSGSTLGGTSITITGTGFLAGAMVTIGGSSATVGTITSTTITATTPAGIAGAKDVVVTNTDAQFATGTGYFTYILANPAPTISLVNPAAGSTAGGTTITITGTGFRGGATVTIGGAAATIVTLTSTSIVATTPPGTAGFKNVVVTNTDNQSATGTGLFTYIAPAPPAPIAPPAPPIIVKTVPVIIWASPAPITADVALSDLQLNATLDPSTKTAGAFVYSPAAGVFLSAGTQTLSVTFTPTDQVNYEIVKKSVSIIVNPAPVQLTPTLGGLNTTYDGSAKNVTVGGVPDGVNYTITYNGAVQLPVNAGVYSVEVKVTSDGYIGGVTGTLTINKASPKLTWSAPLPITSDQILSLTQLNATSDVAGHFAYSPDSGATLPVGNQTLTAIFIPQDEQNYATQQISVPLIVKLLPPIVVPKGVTPPTQLASATPDKGSTVLTSAQIKSTVAAASKKSAVIQIWSYVTPTKNSAADLKLSQSRANDVKNQLMKSAPKATYLIKAMGSTIQPTCAKTKNLCVIVKVVG